MTLEGVIPGFVPAYVGRAGVRVPSDTNTRNFDDEQTSERNRL